MRNSTWSLRSPWFIVSPSDVLAHKVKSASTPAWKLWSSPSSLDCFASAVGVTSITPSFQSTKRGATENFTNVACWCFGTSTPRSSSNFCFKVSLFCITSEVDLFWTRFSANSAACFICFIRDSTSCLAALIRLSIDTCVATRDSIASRSRSRISAIISSATRETSRLAVATFLSSVEIVSSYCLMTSQSSLSLILINLAPHMMLSFSSRAALSSRTTLWFWWSVTMQIWQMQTWHSKQKNRVTSLSWNSCEQNGCRFRTAS